MLRKTIEKISDGEILSRDEARQALEYIFDEKVSHIQTSAFLVALRTRGEKSVELAGMLDAMKARMKTVACADPKAVDVCGTGGDGSGSFNISTAAGLVAAAAGVTVAKHGNRAVSSRSGSADLLVALGISIDAPIAVLEKCLAEHKFAFLFAPMHHGAMKAVAPIRKELGMRTVFNLLGPLANPAGVKRQLVGVFHPRWLRPVIETLKAASAERALVVHSKEGWDEISAAQSTGFIELKNGKLIEDSILPEKLPFTGEKIENPIGGDAEENAKRLQALAANEETHLLPWVAVNAGAAIYLADKAASIAEGCEMATKTIRDGKLAALLDTLRKYHRAS